MKIAACLLLIISSALLVAAQTTHGLGPEKVYQESGYIAVDGGPTTPDGGVHLFYWFFESRNDPKNDPIVIWLTGGPGCSSLTALFFENGPYIIQPDLSLKLNPYSWNSNASVLWIDQPVGTGFSYADYWQDLVFDETQVAYDMYEFLQKFFNNHPLYRQLPFYVFGESYAGHYIPAISQYIVQQNLAGQNPKINLQGVGIGNGWTDPKTQYAEYANFMYSKGMLDLVSTQTYNSTSYPACKYAIENANWLVAFETCGLSMQSVLIAAELEAGRTINVYDVRIPCEVPPLCYDFSLGDRFLAQPSVKQQLGVNPARSWTSCNMPVHFLMLGDWIPNFAQDLPLLLANNVKVLVYSGTEDFICNYMGGKAWVDAMSWPGQTAFNRAAERPWNVNGKLAGLARNAQGLTFLEIYGAGHMAPMDQPAVVLNMFNNFINNKPI